MYSSAAAAARTMLVEECRDAFVNRNVAVVQYLDCMQLRKWIRCIKPF